MTSPITAIVLVGPTGVGKSALALELAQAVQGEIVSVDSRQIYRHMDIGTAKPTAADRARIPHHLVDLVEPSETFSAGRFAAAATTVLRDVQSRGRPAILVGGSGLYLQALMDGLFSEDADETRGPERQHWSQRLQSEGLPALWQELGRVDPAAQLVIEPTDAVRIQRALELSTSGAGRAERWDRDRQPGLDLWGPMVCLSRSRESLYQRIDQRTQDMLSAGWLQEVEQLVHRGHASDPGLATLGYQELRGYLDGASTLAAAEATIQRRTRQYAKRQMTWFRRDRRLRWLELDRVSVAGARRRIVAHFDWLVDRCRR